MNLSRPTVEADTKGVALLTAEGLHGKQLAARYTVVCTDSKRSKVALKAAAEALAARTAAAALPSFVSE